MSFFMLAIPPWKSTDTHLQTIKNKSMPTGTPKAGNDALKAKRRKQYQERKAKELAAQNEAAPARNKKKDKKGGEIKHQLTINANECRLPFKSIRVEDGCIVFTL